MSNREIASIRITLAGEDPTLWGAYEVEAMGLADAVDYTETMDARFCDTVREAVSSDYPNVRLNIRSAFLPLLNVDRKRLDEKHHVEVFGPDEATANTIAADIRHTLSFVVTRSQAAAYLAKRPAPEVELYDPSLTVKP
jgi:hypothetical protein